MSNTEHPSSADEVASKSLLRQEPKQTLLKEVVTARRGADPQEALAEAGKQVAAGQSLFLADLLRRTEKARG